MAKATYFKFTLIIYLLFFLELLDFLESSLAVKDKSYRICYVLARSRITVLSLPLYNTDNILIIEMSIVASILKFVSYFDFD